MPPFTETSLHESGGHKPSQHVEMFATKFVTSPQQTRLHRSNGI